MTKPYIIDFGTVNLRIGKAGDKLPSVIYPPLFGQPLLNSRPNEWSHLSGATGSSWLDYAIFPLNPREKHDNTIPIPAITYEDSEYKLKYNAFDKLLDSATNSKGPEDSFEGSSVIASEPNIHTLSFRKALAEVLVDGQHVEKFYLCKRAPLTCYASGRSSAIVVDVGGSCSNVAAVSEGYVIQQVNKEEPIGGSLIDRIFYGYLNQSGITIRPSFEYTKPTKTEEPPRTKIQKTNEDRRKTVIRPLPFVHQSYYHYAKLYAASRVKETCFVINEQLNIKNKTTDSYFALPDGNYLNTEMGKELCGIFCRCLFNEESYLYNTQMFKEFEVLPLTKPAFEDKDDNLVQLLEKFQGLDGMLVDTFVATGNPENSFCSNDTRNVVILSGGTTRHPAVLPLLRDRFVSRLPGNLPLPQLNKPADVERPSFMSIGGMEQQFSSFIGASILASMGIFDTLCITRSECQEHGIERILQRKCP